MNDIRRVLSYNDVLLCPRNSENEHLSDADLHCKCDGFSESVIPLINAPMDKVCSPELLNCLCEKFKMPVSIHRWFGRAEDQLIYFVSCGIKKKQANRVFLSVGYIGKWKEWIDFLIKEQPKYGYAFLVDMANGDTGSCVKTVSYIREKCPKANIMAGNVATKSGYRRLEEAGANIIRVGIGGGCFLPDTWVQTNYGYKKISEIEEGDLVFTHMGRLRKVLATISYSTNETICVIYVTTHMAIRCTPNHEFFVVRRKDEAVVNENNIHEYAVWIKAEDLTSEHLLVELTVGGHLYPIAIREVEKVNYVGVVHDLTVEEDESYNANGIICHNSICSTRTKCGFGIPTLTSIFDCATVKDKSYLVADGGIEYPGDVCKAVAAGADLVMAGKMFAATSLSGGEKYDKDGCLCDPSDASWVAYRGMASAAAAKALASQKSHVSVEGESGFIPYTGETEDVVEGILGNLRSSLSYYAGVKNWKQFRKAVKFLEITHQGWGESLTRISSSIK